MASIRANARKVVCIGRNYADHIAELKNARPKQPFFFLKPSSSILPPKSGPILAPRGVSVHYEVELACVMNAVKDLDPEDTKGALDAIKGYCLAIDLTGRNVQDEAKRKGLPWSIAKGFDTFCPVSDFVPKARVPDPHGARLQLRVNGALRQDGATDLMLFRVPRIVSEVARVMAFEEGDLLLTGTPKGVGEVKVGDEIEAKLLVGEEEVAGIEVAVADKGGRYTFNET